MDPTPEQWQGILDVVQQKRLLPFFDSAYQARCLAAAVPVLAGSAYVLHDLTLAAGLRQRRSGEGRHPSQALCRRWPGDASGAELCKEYGCVL